MDGVICHKTPASKSWNLEDTVIDRHNELMSIAMFNYVFVKWTYLFATRVVNLSFPVQKI